MLGIKTLTGETYVVDIAKEMTVGDLYKALAEKMKEDEANLRIICRGRLLDNPDLLLIKDLQVCYLTCLHAVVKKNSKPPVG